MSDVRTLGVTGGIGSGKSTVCAYLKGLGAIIFEADLVARELMQSNLQVREETIQAFGYTSYRPDGSLNRSWLADQVFGNEVSLDKLNAIVHPRVAEAFDNLRDRLQIDLLVHEAALIYEAKMEYHLDAICVVSAPDNVRIRRVKSRDNVGESAVRMRMQRQLPPKDTEHRADVVLVNAGNLEQLQHKTQKLYEVAMSGEVLNSETFRSFRRL